MSMRATGWWAAKTGNDEKIYLHPKFSVLVPGVEDVGFPDTGRGPAGRWCRGEAVSPSLGPGPWGQGSVF